MPLRVYGAGVKPGERVFFDLRVLDKRKLVLSSQASAPFGRSATASIRLAGFRPVKGRTYTAQIEANAVSGGGLVLKRTFTLLAK